jgi:hypothetical protein
MSDTSNPTPSPSWQLPPAPGQFGYQPKPDDQAAIPREPPDQSGPPYGFRSGRSLTPYIPTGQNPALRDRPARDWGNPDWVLAGMNNYPDGGTPEGMHVPGEHDILPNIHNSAMFWGRWGPPGLAMPSIAAARYGAAAQQGYAKGQREAAQLNHQQMIDALKLKDYRRAEMMDKYSHAFTAFGPTVDVDGNVTDEGNIDEFYRRIESVAREHGDTTVLGMLENGDWRSIDKLMKSYDSQGQDDSKTLKQLQIAEAREKLKQLQAKAQQEEAENKEWFGSTPPAAPSAAKPDEGQPAPKAPGAPELAPDQSITTSAKPDAAASYDRPLAPQRINDAAREAQMGGKPALPKNDRIKGAVDRQAQALNDYMSNVANDKSLTPDDIHARVRAANPEMDDLVQDLMNGTTELTPKDSDKPFNRIAAQIAHSIDPDWTRNAQKIKEQRDHEARQATILPIRQALGQQEKLRDSILDVVPKNVGDMNILLGLAKRLRDKGYETQIPILNRYLLEGRKNIAGDPDVQAYYAQLDLVRADVGRVLSTGAAGTGAVYPVSAQQEMRKFFDAGINVEQLEATINTIKRDYAVKLWPITSVINDENGRIAQIEGTKPPEAVSDAKFNKIMEADEFKYINGKIYYKREGEWHDD